MIKLISALTAVIMATAPTAVEDANSIHRARGIAPLSVYVGDVLNPINGRIYGPSGVETYYNLDMSYIVERMMEWGYIGEYWVRDDGVKMYGDYVMVAANLDVRPIGTTLDTSLGLGIVCDTGAFASNDPYQLDIAVSW